jgi:hypothetical protein
MATPVSSAPVGFVLDFDPDLAAGIGRGDLELARQACRGEVVRVPRGVWDGPAGAGRRDDLFALLIVGGVLCREVVLRDRYLFELLGPGDVLQLPVDDGLQPLGGGVRLTAATESELIALGGSFIRAAGRWPCLISSVMRRLEQQRERLAIQGLIAHLPRAEDRTVLVLWHLADRWGRVTSEGTVVPFALTHELIGQLIGARRSTVTIAVNALETGGVVRRLTDRSWLLTAQAETIVSAFGGAGRPMPTLGESFLLRHRAEETAMHAMALRAAARQTRSKGGRPIGERSSRLRPPIREGSEAAERAAEAARSARARAEMAACRRERAAVRQAELA